MIHNAHKSGKSFADLRPDLVPEWHPTKNGDLHPDYVKPNCAQKVWWLGKCGHEWKTTVFARNRGDGCPFCANHKLLKGFNDLATVRPDLADEWHPTKNGDLTPDTVLARTSKEVVWFGKCGHEWSSKVVYRVKGSGCPYCNNDRVLKGFNDLATTHPSLAAEWHPIKNDFMPDSVTAGSHKSVVWLGQCGHEWVTTVNDRTSRKSSCPFCSNHKLLKGFNDFATRFPDVAEEWHPTKNGALTPSDFMLSQRKAWWLCPVCGYEWDAFVKSRARGAGCPACANRRKGKHSKVDDVLKK